MVNGPEILDKFVGEAEARVRALFAPAEAEWAAAGDASALHVIILDEMDSIARRRGSASGDSSGVRDSVVNQVWRASKARTYMYVYVYIYIYILYIMYIYTYTYIYI